MFSAVPYPSLIPFAHCYLTARPCQRCIKRGMADNCTEGHRKKAKYLLDEEELGPCLYCSLISIESLTIKSRGPQTQQQQIRRCICHTVRDARNTT